MFTYRCECEDSSTFTVNFGSKYFCNKQKYDKEKIFEQYYSLEKSAINFAGENEVIYNIWKFS